MRAKSLRFQDLRSNRGKRDVGEKNDPQAFRDSIFAGLNDILNNKQHNSSSSSTAPKVSPTNPNVQLIAAAASTAVPVESTENDASNEADEVTEGLKAVELTGSAESGDLVVKNGSSDGASVGSNGPSSDSSTNAVTIQTLEALAKYLDAFSTKLDYKKYGEVLFDILVAGGILGQYSCH